MSSGTDDSDSDSDISDASSDDDSSIVINYQLSAAIQARNLDSLRSLLSQVDESGLPAVADDDIHTALFIAVLVGSDGACRLLWEKLSRRGRRIYLKATLNGYGPLHAAAWCGRLLHIVRLFIEEFKWNINQKDDLGRTPLCCSIDQLEMDLETDLATAHFLLEKGANVNIGGKKYSPLWCAVNANNTELSHLLLVDYQANPNLNRRPFDEEDDPNRQYILRCTDLAIRNGNAEILRLLLDHGAFVIYHKTADVPHTTSLNTLFSIHQESIETKLSIAHMLVEHASVDRATAKFMKASFTFEVTPTTNHRACRILLDAGIDPRMSMYCAIRANNHPICQLLVQMYESIPFCNKITRMMMMMRPPLPPHSLLLPVSQTLAFLNTFWIFGIRDSPLLVAETVTATIRFMLFVVMHMFLLKQLRCW